jgi:DNA-binding beta-propeller fold protein YncE
MYVAGNQGDDINEYDLSTAWDISTATFLQSFSVAAQDAQLRGLFFKPDGLKMYVAGNTGDDINEYNLSTAWDVSTASYVQSFSVASQDTSPQAVFFKPDGTKMYVLGGVGVDINEYDLSTSWDISTASYAQAFSVSSEETVPLGLFFKPDGTAMYITGNTNDTVYQYSTATPATITYDPTLQWPFGTAPTSPAIGETDIITFNTTDGGTTYKSVVAIDGAK